MANIISLIVLICSFGVIFGYARPLYQGVTGSSNFADKSVKELKVDIKKYSEAFDRIREIEEIKGGLQTKYNSILEKDREKIVKALPEEVDVIRLIVDLNERTAVYGMSMKNISIEKGSSEPSYSRPGEMGGASGYNLPNVGLGFEVSSNYDNLISFLGDLEKSLRLLELSSVSISSVSDIDKSSQLVSGGEVKPTTKVLPSNVYSAKINIKSYYLPKIIDSASETLEGNNLNEDGTVPVRTAI